MAASMQQIGWPYGVLFDVGYCDGKEVDIVDREAVQDFFHPLLPIVRPGGGLEHFPIDKDERSHS